MVISRNVAQVKISLEIWSLKLRLNIASCELSIAQDHFAKDKRSATKTMQHYELTWNRALKGATRAMGRHFKLCNYQHWVQNDNYFIIDRYAILYFVLIYLDTQTWYLSY